jgi:acyl carrier protein
MSAELNNIIAKVMKVPVSRVNDECGPETVDHWDSLRVLVLLDEVEKAFNVRFSLDELETIRTVKDIKSSLQHNHGISLGK